jgi:hypothetical protein
MLLGRVPFLWNLSWNRSLFYMPVFYFDVREDTRFAPDEEGTNLPDIDAAEEEAAEVAALIGRDKLPSRNTRSVIVEVRNEYGQRVLTVTVTLDIDRVEPPPTPPITFLRRV